MSKNEKTAIQISRETVRSLMVLFPLAIVLGAVSIYLFFVYLPRNAAIQKINDSYSQRRALQEDIRQTKAALEGKSGNEKLQKLLEEREKVLLECQTAIDRYGLSGYYLHTITDRSDLTNALFLNGIIFVGFIIIWYYLLICLYPTVPGLHILSVDPLKSAFYLKRIQQLEAKYKQTGDHDAVHAENEYLSSLEENRALISLVPFQFGEWIMPILGFLGTVVGVSGAINELQVGIRIVFGEGKLTYIALEKFNSGFKSLGMAFDTTFLGLIGLALSGMMAFMLRRRAIAAIHTIDANANNWITGLEMKSREEVLTEKLGQFFKEIIEWYGKNIRPGIEEEQKKNEKFRELVAKEFETSNGRFEALLRELSSIRGLLSRIPQQIVNPLKKSTDYLTLRINTYGEYLTRLAGMDWKANSTAARIQSFLTGCLVEAAMGPEDQFIPRLIEALRRPALHAPNMALLKEPDGNPIESIAVSSSYYLAAAMTQGQMSKIELYRLDMALNYKVGNSRLEAEINSKIKGLAFNSRGNLLAYLCIDGTLGVYNIQSEKSTDMVIPRLQPQTHQIVWIHMGREYVAIPSWNDEKKMTQLLLVPYENECIGGEQRKNLSCLDIKDFCCRSALFSHRQCRLILAGDSGGQACIKIAIEHQNAFVVRQEKIIPKGAVLNMSFTNPNEDQVLCSMDNGEIYKVQLNDDSSPERLLSIGEGPVLFAESEEMGQFLLACCKGQSRLHLYESWDKPIAINGYNVIRLGKSLPGHEGIVVGGEDGHLAMWEYPTSFGGTIRYKEGEIK